MIIHRILNAKHKMLRPKIFFKSMIVMAKTEIAHMICCYFTLNQNWAVNTLDQSVGIRVDIPSTNWKQSTHCVNVKCDIDLGGHNKFLTRNWQQTTDFHKVLI